MHAVESVERESRFNLFAHFQENRSVILSISIRNDAIDASVCTGEKMLLARGGGVVSYHLLKQAQFGAAKSLARARGGADRAVVFNQEPVVPVAFDPRHVTLVGA